MKTRESRYYRALYQVAVTINSSLDPQQVLRAIAQSAAEALEAKGCSVMLLNPDRRELYHSAAYGISDWYARKGPVSVDRSMAGALAGRPVAVLDAGHDPRVQYGPQAIKEGISSILSVPIKLRDDVIGVMRVYSAEPRKFRADEIEFVQAVAHLGAIALENARRYTELRADYEGVRQDLQEWSVLLGSGAIR